MHNIMQTVTQEINKGFKDYGKHSKALTMLGSKQKKKKQHFAKSA